MMLGRMQCKLRQFGRAARMLCLSLLAALTLAGCTPYYEDYLGTWVGIDESDPVNMVLYEYHIVTAGGQDYAIRLTRSYYEVDPDLGARWINSQPRFLIAHYDPESGRVQAPFGELDFEIGHGNIKFGTINFIRKAKNTELKLKYVARQAIKRAYPDLPVTD